MTDSDDVEHISEVLSGPKRQHYLPRFYLKGFSGTDGCVAVFDRVKNELRRQRPENTAVTGHLYTLTDEHGRQRYEIEAALSSIEGDAARAIERLLNEGTCNESDREAVAYFVATLAVRTPSFIDSVRHGNGRLLKHVLSHMYGDEESAIRALRGLEDREWESEDEMRRIARLLVETMDSEDYVVEVDQQHAVSTSLGLADALVPIFMQREWKLIDAPKKSSFVVSDGGIALTALIRHPQYRGLGYGSPHALTFVPLTSRTALAMWGESEKISRQTADSLKVRQINLELAKDVQRFLLGRDDNLVHAVANAAKLAERKWAPKFTVT